MQWAFVFAFQFYIESQYAMTENNIGLSTIFFKFIATKVDMTL